MQLQFPNRTRVVNPATKSISFSGHEGVMEVRFSVPFRALEVSNYSKPATPTSYLAAFDAMREKIQKAAEIAHSRGRKPFHILDVASF